MKKYSINKDFFPFSFFTPPFKKAKTAGWIGSFMKPPKWIFKDKDIFVKKEKITSYDSNQIDILVFSPKNDTSKLPCLVYFHGGGFFLGAAGYHYKNAKEYTINVNCKVIFIQYRITPKNPYPTPLEDCYSALKWTIDNSDYLNIDKNKIAVGGDSAGGCLAASVCLLARDRLIQPPLFQLLIYPVIDIDMNSNSNKVYTNTPMWNSKLSKIMWNAYVQDKSLESSYASPIKAKNLSNLPKAYIETAEFDCLHDEALIYANLLSNNKIEVIINETKETMHGFDIVQNSSITKCAIQKRIDYMKKQFNK
ncbi:MAG: alpha/beta hydrolase [Bacilli bacterium]|nr:alpha/beta hydrolase [Bacilli bacterium]